MGKVAQVALFEGLPERYARRMVLENVTVAEAAAGVCCSMATEVKIDNLTVGTPESTVVDAREIERLEVHRVSAPRPRDGAPMVWLDNVTSAFIHGCSVGEAQAGYEWVRHQQSQGVTLAANHAPQVTAVASTPGR
jgi:hypothetical protein